jgi:hypothetical protein
MMRVGEYVRNFLPKLLLQNKWLLHHDNATSHTSFYTREVLTKTNMTHVPHQSYFSLFPRLKTKPKGRYFNIQVIEADLQAVLNTLIEHDFQDPF